MSSNEKTVQYTALEAGDKVQEGDQWLDKFEKWQPYVLLYGVNRVVGYGVRARRPICATHQTTYEEVPDSRTLQQAVEQPQRVRWAYEELQTGDVIEAGDQWQNSDGRWHALVLIPGASTQVRDSIRARRPHNITLMLTEFANQAEVLAEVRADEKRLFDDLELLRSEYAKLQRERDEARAALKSAQRARDELQRRVDELHEQQSPATPADQLSFHELREKRIASLEDDLSQVRADSDKLQGLIDDLLDEPTARQVHQMLRTWATELDWSACCFDSVGRDKVSAVQRVLVAVIERIGGMINPEATSADA